VRFIFPNSVSDALIAFYFLHKLDPSPLVLHKLDPSPLVVVRTGQLDRALSISDSAPQDRLKTVTDPVYREYPDLADLLERQL
jgi:hypothetical protein